MAEVEIIQPQHGTQIAVAEFGSFRNPEQALHEAELVAKAFGRRAGELQLFKQIGESRHLKIEGWQMLAMMYRVTAGVVDTRYVEFGDAEGWEATAEALLIRGGGLPPVRISIAQAMCMNDEERWDTRPVYKYVENERKQVGTTVVPLQQLRSMAQTRACSKVLSNLLKFVAVLAGYSGTPAEEMTGNEGSTQRPAGQQPQRNGKAAPTDPISEPQLGRLFAIAKTAGKSEEAVGVILEHFKYPTADGIRAAAAKVQRQHYDAICTAVMQP